MALSGDLVFKLGNSGVELNTSVSLPFVDITKVTGLDSAPYRETQRDHEGVDGGFMDAEFERGRSIVLEGTVYADTATMETYLDSLKENYAPSRTLIPFYLQPPGTGERVVFVKPLGCRYDWETMRRTGQSAIQFSMFAEDPRIYSSELLQQVIAQGVAAITGRGYNKGYNYTYGATVTPSQTNCVNSGNRDTPVVMTITGPVTNPTIFNDTEGTSLRFLLTLSATDTLVVDTQYHTVRVNGVSRRGALVNPNWFFLHKGDNFLRYQADTVGSSTCTVAFRSAWR